MKRFILLLFTCFFCGILFPQNNLDSLQHLNEVVVTAAVAPVAYRATSVVQTLSATEWQQMGALQVADAVKHFAGAQVKDYGGVGGLKTVSVRSLGAHYTVVVYDDIAISDYQTGQVDVGRFSLANLGEMRLAIGESDEIFQPARNQALGATLFLKSTSPFASNKPLGIETSLRVGSFGLVNQSAKITKTFGQRYAFDVSGEYLRTDGNYPFTITDELYENTESGRRINSDVDNKQAEVNFHANFRNNGKLRVKTYAYHSERGIPGPVRMHNPSSTERVEDRNFFTQAHYGQSLGERWQIRGDAKIAGMKMNLTNSSSDADYAQQEYFGSVGVRFQVTENLSFVWVNDALHGTFSAKFAALSKEVDAERNTWLSALGAAYETRRMTVTGRLLSQFSDNLNDRRHLSPYLGVSVQPIYSLPLRLRAFYKNTFRQPTFGDMYFSPVPPLNLRAENTHQYNAGFTYYRQRNANKPSFSLSADAYYNKAENKIAVFPQGSMAVWSMKNYKEAVIRGIDLSGNLRLPFSEKYAFSMTANYTYQKVEDRTEGKYYGSHLPYTPRHVGSGIVQLTLPYFDVAYSLIYSGERYYNQSDLPRYRLSSYTDQNLTVSRTFYFNKQEIRLSIECANLLNENYQVVQRYPMPGRSFRVIFDYKF